MKRVVVVGLGRSGIEACRLLAECGERVSVTDIRDDEDIRKAVDVLVEEGVIEGHNIELGRHTRRFIRNADLVVISPGVRSDSRPVRLAEEMHIPVIGELELAYSMCPSPIIAVTGTSGKTTVTTLVGEILKTSGRDTIVCGNIGNPLSAEIKRIKPESIVVLEVSSFQLEKIKTFRPNISVILNISENHLDRHRDMEEYIALKSRVFSNQTRGDTLFLNSQDKILRDMARGLDRPKVEFFDRYKNFKRRYNIDNEDHLAAMSICSLLNVSENIILEVVYNFRGIKDRLEYVTAVNGVDFINDSKATTISSVEWALKSLGGNIVLIMGGRFKGGDFNRLENYVRKKVSYIIAIGEAQLKIKQAFSGVVPFRQEDTLEGAVHTAFNLAQKGDKVLLSPGCSSFDMFKNYEERGRVFRHLCLKLSSRFLS